MYVMYMYVHCTLCIFSHRACGDDAGKIISGNAECTLTCTCTCIHMYIRALCMYMYMYVYDHFFTCTCVYTFTYYFLSAIFFASMLNFMFLLCIMY